MHNADRTEVHCEKHDDQTMSKVFHALKRIVEDDDTVLDAINEMLNDGILFRERG
jgi:hypothetical protein